MSRPNAARVFALVLLGLVGCMESPFAPAPDRAACGAGGPCPFTCSFDCGTTTVDLAASCMLTLEGAFDATRTRCEFADGSSVRFAWPVPPVGSDLTWRKWNITLDKKQGRCLSIQAEPFPWVAGGYRSTASVKTSSGEYRHTLQMSSTSDGGGQAPTLEDIQVTCPGGKQYAGKGPDLCAGCPEGLCSRLPLLQLVASWSKTLEISLRAGDRITPLFTCR